MPAADSTWPSSVGVIGAGAMGGAFAAGIARGAAPPRILVADAVGEAAAHGAAGCGGDVSDVAGAAACDVVVLAVKPKDVPEALEAVRARHGDPPVLVSVAAGWDLARLRREIPSGGIVRTMPNLAVRHGAGLVAVAADELPADRHAAVLRLLAPLGEVVEVDETLFPAATALAGSGPGLVALMAEGLEEGGVRAGLTRAQSRAMGRAVLAGVAALLADGKDPASLRQMVSSPAGTTVEGVAVLERGAVRAHIADAVVAAAEKSKVM